MTAMSFSPVPLLCTGVGPDEAGPTPWLLVRRAALPGAHVEQEQCSSATPQVTKMSATLKTGKSMNVVAIKSVTEPVARRSIMLPTPPPATHSEREHERQGQVLAPHDATPRKGTTARHDERRASRPSPEAEGRAVVLHVQEVQHPRDEGLALPYAQDGAHRELRRLVKHQHEARGDPEHDRPGAPCRNLARRYHATATPRPRAAPRRRGTSRTGRPRPARASSSSAGTSRHWREGPRRKAPRRRAGRRRSTRRPPPGRSRLAPPSSSEVLLGQRQLGAGGLRGLLGDAGRRCASS